MPKKKIYLVRFLGDKQIYELYAHQVSSSHLPGFIEINELIWDQQTDLVIDPSEERLRVEMNGVTSIILPIHSVQRIDVVKDKGTPKIKAASGYSGSSNITSFPHVKRDKF
jgi:hypothetical protein